MTTINYAQSFEKIETPELLRDYSIIGVRNGDEVLVVGQNEAGDHGGGIFIWNQTSTEDDDGVTVIQPAFVSGAGRWCKQAGGGSVVGDQVRFVEWGEGANYYPVGDVYSEGLLVRPTDENDNFYDPDKNQVVLINPGPEVHNHDSDFGFINYGYQNPLSFESGDGIRITIEDDDRFEEWGHKKIVISNTGSSGGGETPTAPQPSYKGEFVDPYTSDRNIYLENGIPSDFVNLVNQHQITLIYAPDTAISTTQALTFGGTINTNDGAGFDMPMNGTGFSVRYWLQSEAGYDKFTIYIDNVQAFQDSGVKSGYLEQYIALTPGDHTVTFYYQTDSSQSSGFNNVRISNIYVNDSLNPGDNYIYSDTVSYGGNIYFCLKTGSTGIPGESDGWVMFGYNPPPV